MLTLFELQEIVENQTKRLSVLDDGMARAVSIPEVMTSHALIISGIRRCGKSTLMRQLLNRESENSLYLNFEDPRLGAFDYDDFERLGKYAENNDIRHFYLDEIQNVAQWENFVRFKLDEGFHFTITGSNASLLSRELGTKLTGRHLTEELFPFSYAEYLSFTEREKGAESLQAYMQKGGFPEYIKADNDEILFQVFNDILLRDIAVRYNIKQTQVLRALASFILSNSGNRMSANALRKQFGIASNSTINEYLNYLQDSYLFQSVGKFSYSLKSRQVNPKKWYAIDTGLISVNTRSLSPDRGRLLETLVYLHLRRHFKEIFYFSDKKECDFVAFNNARTPVAIQVCYALDSMNKERELDGLLEAVDFFHLDGGLIVTFNQEDTMTMNGKTIAIVPAWKWLQNE